MTEEEKKKEKKVKKPAGPVSQVILRDYPKVIFFWPLLVLTGIMWPINALIGVDAGSVLGIIWFITFFCNIFVIAFDFSSTKVLILILAIIVVVMILIIMGVSVPTAGITIDLSLSTEFFAVMFLILGFILLFVLISAHFDYWKIEHNEIYHKSGLVGSADRYPVKSLRIQKAIPDIFEYIALRAGSITLIPSKDKVIHLNTVLNINKKAEQIDHLLSRMRVEIDDHI